MRLLSVLGILLAVFAAGCAISALIIALDVSSPTGTASTRAAAAKPADPGDLLKVETSSTKIGVLLDDMPADVRNVYAASIMTKNDAWWRARVYKQFSNVYYKLTFLYAFYPNKQALVPPSEEASLRVVFTSAPRRSMISGVELIWRSYTLTTYIVGARNSAVVSDAALGKMGGKTEVPFSLPIDPYLLYQRTGYACADEDQFPHNSLDAEATDIYYDDTCTAGPAVDPGVECIWDQVGCHCSEGATQSCNEALADHVGRSRMTMTFTRIAWDETIATQMESHNVNPLNLAAAGADLVGHVPALEHNWVVYDYFPAGSCETLECIDGDGWRRLLKFDSIHTNVGTADMVIGALNYTANEPDTFDQASFHNLYYWDPCHHHPHFSEYANYFYGGAERGHKQGFCIQTTNRLINSRNVTIYSTNPKCDNQGIGRGWSDNYNGGIPCQWIDVTDVDTSAGPVVDDLSMIGNPSNWLCEGLPVFYPNGSRQWQYTGNVTTAPPYPQAGLAIDKYKCVTSPGALNNNVDAIPVVLGVPGTGLLTSDCPDGNDQIAGPKRDCGFSPLDMYRACNAPGASVSMVCTATGTYSQVLRVCEASIALGTGTACRFNDDFTLANVVLTPGQATPVTFVCPAARDDLEVGGFYATYYGAAFVQAAYPGAVSCAEVA